MPLSADSKSLLSEAATRLMEGDAQGARELAEAALACGAENAEALHFLALLSARAGDLVGGAELLNRALRAKPTVAGWYRDLATICAADGRWGDASRACDGGLAAVPDDIGLLAFRGRALLKCGQPNGSLSAYERAHTLAPHDLEVAEGRARALYSLKRNAEAVEVLEKCLEVDRGRISSHKLIAEIYDDLGFVHLAREHRRAWVDLSDNDFQAIASLAIDDWETGNLRDCIRGCRTIIEAGAASAELHSFYLYALLYESEAGPGEVRRHHEEWFAAHGPSTRFETYANLPQPERRLRIGYLSGEFFCGAAFHFLFPLLRSHDRTQFEVFCYDSRAKCDACSELYQQVADVWLDVAGWTEAQLAQRIRDDTIDILVDLSGHFPYNRMAVFQSRPAPVQVTIPNYPSTTGASGIDYIISDPWLSPLKSDDEYSEKVLRMPSGYLPYQPPANTPAVSTLPALRNGFVTFGLFQRPAKVNARVWDVIAEALRLLPNSRLLVHYALKELDMPKSEARCQVIREMEARGVSGERASLRGSMPHKQHMALIGEADIALDTFPYNGQTTTCECLWMGVPVISVVGEKHVARMGFSLLNRVGIGELAATSLQGYVETATALALDLKRLAKLRSELRLRMQQSSLLDARAVTRDLESMYRRMWSQWCSSTARPRR